MNHALGERTDHATVIGPDHAAPVVGPDGALQLFLRDKADDAAPLPLNMALLVC